MSSPEIYIIDGSAYIYRAYHAVRPLSNSSGVPTHAVYGFATMLRKLINEKNPEYLAVAFDSKGPVFRHEMYSEYKANRPPMPDDLVPQIPFIHNLIDAYNILSLKQAGQEADDLIASSVRHLTDQECQVVIVSGDKDLLQLVSDKVTLWDPMNDRVMNEEEVEKKYGVPRSALLDYFSLVGDSSDNVPGVPGVGPKTAQKLIAQHRSLEGLYGAVDQLKQSKMKENIIAHKEMAYLSRELIRLNEKAEVPAAIEQYKRAEPNDEQLRELYTELEFHTLLKNEVQTTRVATDTFTLIQTVEALDELVEILRTADHLVLDTETDSLNPRKANLVGISVCVDASAAWYIPCGHVDGEGRVAGQLDLALVIEKMQPVLEHPEIVKIGHNLKYDYAVLAASQNGGVHLQGALHDTMIGTWLLDPGRRSYKLDDLCEEMDIRMTSFSEVVGGSKSEDAFARVPLEAAKDYSCEDVYGAYMLYAVQKEQLAAVNLLELLTELEGPAIKVLADMEKQGVVVDGQRLAQLAEEFGNQLDQYEEQIYEAAGHPFTIQSPKQLGVILFEELQLPKGRKTKTGWSTDVKVLEKLKEHHRLPALILEYRNIAKLKSTYVDKLTLLRDTQSSRVHTSYNQCGTATGRLSSSNPNLQNIPIRTEEGRRIRSAFRAEQGCYLLAGDYSQIDLRVLAHYCQDEQLLAAFKQGDDIHTRTAGQIFSVAPELITPEMRRAAKAINFGIVYGMSSFGLSNQLNVSRKEAQTFIDRYFAHFPGIRTYMDRTIEQAKENGFVTTLMGRRRNVPEVLSTNKTKREFAERIAINTPIQGTAADIMKLAMLKVAEALQEGGFASRMILQIHDELVLEVPEAELNAVAKLLQVTMEHAMPLDVPLVVNLGYGQHLGKDTQQVIEKN